MTTRKGFGGRLRKQAIERGDRVHLGFRVTPEMKQRLEEAAAASGRSQSQEAEMRLKQSFDYQELLPQVLALRYDRQLAAVVLLLGEAMGSIGNTATLCTPLPGGKPGTHKEFYEEVLAILDREKKWLEIPYLFDQAVKAVNFLLEALRPPGEINLPPVALKKGPPGTRPENEPFQTYSRLGETCADLLLGEVARGEPATQSDHALVIHQMLGPALLDQIEQFAPPGEPKDQK